jgi:hypothetical protein
MSYDQPLKPSPYATPTYPTDAPYPTYEGQYYPPDYPPQPRPLNGYALASLVISITSLMSCLVFLSPVGAILGHVAHRQIAERNEQGAGMATVGIIIGWLGTAAMVSAIAAVTMSFWV